MLVRPDCGPRMRFVFVLTNAPLETTEHTPTELCKKDCTACACACPMKALSANNLTEVIIRAGEVYKAMKRDETRCMWSRSLAMCEGAGAGQLGWIIPNKEVPNEITSETIEDALNSKDKVQTICYRNPNFTDIIVERCLQVCPIGKKHRGC